MSPLKNAAKMQRKNMTCKEKIKQENARNERMSFMESMTLIIYSYRQKYRKCKSQKEIWPGIITAFFQIETKEKVLQL